MHGRLEDLADHQHSALVCPLTPIQRGIPGSHELGMAFVYLYVARMGAVRPSLSEVVDTGHPVLWLGATLWIFIHGAILFAGRQTASRRRAYGSYRQRGKHRRSGLGFDCCFAPSTQLGASQHPHGATGLRDR